MILISTFAIFVGTAPADIGPFEPIKLDPDTWGNPLSKPISYKILPLKDIVDINVEEYGTALISNVKCKIDFDVYPEAGSKSLLLQSFPVFFLLPKNAENITVKVNKKKYIHDPTIRIGHYSPYPPYAYHFVPNAFEYINNSVNSSSEYINDYNVIEWTVWRDDWQTYDAISGCYYMPVDINVTYSHILDESNQTYTLRYALIPLDYKEINVGIKLPKNTNTDTIIYNPKQLNLSYNDTATYLHLNESNVDHHVPFGDVEVRFSLTSNQPSNTSPSTNPKLPFSSYYHPINISINHSVPPYQLPLNFSNISNIENITADFWLNERYKDMKEKGIPILVTTDAIIEKLR